MNFNFGEDEEFFRELLCDEGEDLSRYDCLFDARPKDLKLREYRQIRAKAKKHLEKIYGKVCQLRLSPECEGASESLEVDHLIPLQTNLRNKARGVAPLPGHKVAGVSYGSNHLCNLSLACRHCNRVMKRWHFLSREQIKRILAVKNFPDGCANTNI